MEVKKERKEDGDLTQKKNNLVQNDDGGDRQEEYPTSVPLYPQVCAKDGVYSSGLFSPPSFCIRLVLFNVVISTFLCLFTSVLTSKVFHSRTFPCLTLVIATMS